MIHMKYPLNEAKEQILTALQSILAQFSYPKDIHLDIPKPAHGDYAFPCFPLAGFLKKSPQEIAQNIASRLSDLSWIQKTEIQGGYLNFYVDEQQLVRKTLDLILTHKEEYGHLNKKNQKIIIEHTSANPNGPLHVGRARNPLIGDTLVRLYRAAGYDVESQFYVDDLGKQVAILTWGLRHVKQDDTKEVSSTKPDHKLVQYYQQAHQRMQDDPEVTQAINEIIQKSEKGDEKIIQQVHDAYMPVLDGMKQSLKRMNIFLDRFVPESQFVKDKSVDNVVEQLQQTTYADKEDNAWFLDLASFGIQGRSTRFFFTRQDGTTLYATRDIAYHLWKAKQANSLVNVLGEDHKLEAQQVAIALKLLKASTTPHVIFYAFVSLPGGKMSTRRGRVVYLDDLIEESVQRAYKEVQKRRGSELSTQQMKEIAEVIGTSAIRYNIIKVQPEKDMVFTWEDALSFEGNAAPFLHYAHARTCGILAKATKPYKKGNTEELSHPSELMCIKHLARFPQVIDEATHSGKPHMIAGYIYELASLFNQFYRDCPVLTNTNQELMNARLQLVDATRIVLHNAMELLGLPALEEM